MLVIDPGRCSNGKAPRADTESAPTVQGDDACHPKQITKTKIPEQTFEDFGADEGFEPTLF